jgi:hypothetical protein
MPTSKEWPVTEEDLDLLADEALGPEPDIAPSDDFVRSGPEEEGYEHTILHARQRAKRLAAIPSVRDALSKRRKRAFLMAIATEGNLALACAAAGWTVPVAKSARKGDPEFAAQWDAALENSKSLLEAEARRRGVHGVKEPVFHKGMVVGHITKYSDGLLTTLLRAELPEKYGNKVDMTVQSKGGVLVVPAAPSKDEWEAQAGAGQAKFREATEG